MQKLIKRYMLLTMIGTFLELGILLFGFFIYYYNLFNFAYIQETTFAIAAFFVVLNLFYFMFVINSINKIKTKNEITAAEVLGEDIQEAYAFGNIGIVIIDNTGTIIWTNEYFNDLQSRLVDSNIYDLMPNLIELKKKDSGSIITTEIEHKVFNVELLKEANVFIFKDVTELEAVKKFSKDHAPVVGVISIDDFKDITTALDENKSYELISTIQKELFDYGKTFNMIINRVRSDFYTFVCNKIDYDRIMEDHFSILDKTKEAVKNEDFQISLSIGVGYGSEDYQKNNEMAFSSLDVCLSRGGDQAVIQPFGEKLIFVGGKSESIGHRSNVKIKVLASSMYTLVKNASSILIMGHTLLDLDALGAALGMYEFAKDSGHPVHIVFDEKIVESKTKQAFKQMYTREEISEMTISPKEALEKIDKDTLLILVDIHRPSMTMSPEIVEKTNRIAIIDHHRRGEEFVDNPVFTYLETSASSTCEMVSELIRFSERHIKLPEKIATIMLAGILLDTNRYINHTSQRTYEASSFLKQYDADNIIADSFLKEDWSESQLKTKIMATAVHEYTGVVVCTYEDNDPIDRTMLSMVAQEMLNIKGINACFVIGKTDSKEVSISARSDGSINVMYLLEKLGGGGHLGAAAVQLLDTDVMTVHTKLKEVLGLYLADARTNEN